MSKIYSKDVVLIKRKNKLFKKILFVLLTLLVFTAMFFGGVGLSNLLSKNGIIWFKNNKIIVNASNYYVVNFGEFDNEKEALDCAIWTGASGGAAYVYHNQKYLVSGQLYDHVDNANKVVENFSKDITYPASVKQFKTSKVVFKIDGLQAKDKRQIENSIKLITDTINDITSISNNIDTNVYSNVSASSEINLLKSEVKIAKTNIDSINVNYNNSNLQQISDLLLKMVDMLDVCVNKLLTSENYSGVCKYLACEIFFNYYDFTKNLNK